MSYQVIARKWRPSDFSGIIGQEHVTQTLLNALKNDRLHHALLFTGPRGTGKTSTARVLAKALRCPEDPKGECAEAKDIAAGRSVDVIEIDGASNNGVDAIRELRDTVAYMPSSGQYKIYIIDEVHMLSTAAFNALLKTLEEPPSHVIFIMATTEAHKIPITILSRCQRYDFRRIPLKMITDHLQTICQAEGVEVDRDALFMIARQGEGSMRDSQSLLDQVITFCGQKIHREDVIRVLGLTDRQILIECLDGLLQRDSERTLNCALKIFEAGYDHRLFIRDLLEEVRHALLIKVAGMRASDILDLPETEIQALMKQAESVTEEELHMLFDMTLKGANDLSRAQDPQIVLEMLLLRMAGAPRIVSLKGTGIFSTSGAEVKPTSSASTKSPRQVSSPSSPADRWLAFVDQIKKVNPLVGANLEHCVFVRSENKKVYLSLPGKMKFMADKVTTPDFVKKVSNYLSTYWEPGFQVEVEIQNASSSVGLTAKAIQEKKEQEKWEAIRKQVESHPMIQASKDILKTEIKSIKEIKS
ncbi:MAG: DNA polymerase III subunit gamma/tau [Bdellovibrionales bacterium]|nr:DNA polymerase III subunit gamma/tau [Bdellovibrionales bacterium]